MKMKRESLKKWLLWSCLMVFIFFMGLVDSWYYWVIKSIPITVYVWTFNRCLLCPHSKQYRTHIWLKSGIYLLSKIWVEKPPNIFILKQGFRILLMFTSLNLIRNGKGSHQPDRINGLFVLAYTTTKGQLWSVCCICISFSWCMYIVSS